MNGLENYAGPYLLLVGVLGILFWLKISQLLVPAAEKSKIINFISNHTFEIMINHVIFMWLINLLLVLLSGSVDFWDFNKEIAINDPWYRWLGANWIRYLYFVAGMLGSMLVAFLTDKVKVFVSGRKEKWKMNQSL